MAHDENISAPITVIGHGRSGTSVLQNVFAAHPEFDVAGETSDLIFGVWLAMERARGIIRGQSEDGRMVSYERRCASVVRGLFLNLFPSEKPYWMHKPIGHSFAKDILTRDGRSESEYFGWYWRVLGAVFPDARCITILRHPCDVVLSAKYYWGRAEQYTWEALASLARCIRHESSMLGYAIPYEDLVESPAATLKSLFDYLDIAFDPRVVEATRRVHVPEMGVFMEDSARYPEKIKARFSRREQWGELNATDVSREQLQDLADLWREFGYDFDLPAQFTRPG